MTRFFFSLLALAACGLIGCERHPASELALEPGEGETPHAVPAETPAATPVPASPAPAKSPEYFPSGK